MLDTCHYDNSITSYPIHIGLVTFQPLKAELPGTLPAQGIDEASGSFVAIGIGKAHSFTGHLVEAPWSTGLRFPAGKVRTGVAGSLDGINPLPLAVFTATSRPHVASIALPPRPNSGDINLANCLTRHLHRLGTFVVITGPAVPEAVFISSGINSDCYVAGDCSPEHHFYPTRTITDPLKGRMICYELYDVLSMWAGRIGVFDALLPRCAAIHIEVPASVGNLECVDRAVEQFRKRLHAETEELISVIPMSPGTTARSTCFIQSAIINQTCARRYRTDLL